MRTAGLTTVLMTLAWAAVTRAAGGLAEGPPWENRPHASFSVADGTLFADGQPMPLCYAFTWSAPHDEAFFRYFSQYLGNAHWEPIALNLDGPLPTAHLDRIYEIAARAGVYVTICPSVQHAAYADDTSFALGPQGQRTSGRSFLHPGYRAALAAKLTELAEYVRDKPFHLGWYPQDEFAYNGFGGFEACSQEVFRERLRGKYADLAALNTAWGTDFATWEAIEPPRAFERSARFADWQEFRRWAQLDFARFVYDTLKAADPDGVVIWSLPFFGGWWDAASWWDFAACSDVLMRHGIGFVGGIFRLVMLRSVSAWSGKPANALCMPPDYDPAYVQMGYLLEGPNTGLSHVCPGGSSEHTYYQGAADSEAGYRRKEPIYTASRSLNDLVRYLGPTFLQGRRPRLQVGVFVSDRTVLTAGADINGLNGVLLLLSDLNLDAEIFAEPSLGELERFDAIFVGRYSQCTDPAVAQRFAEYARSGGLLVLTDGAFTADECNRPLPGNPAESLAGLCGSVEAGRRPADAPLRVARPEPGLPAELPAIGEISLRRLDGATAVATTADGTPVITRHGGLLFCGVDFGLLYQKGYTDDYAGVGKTDDKQLLDEFAGVGFASTAAEIRASERQPHRAWAQFFRTLLAAEGITPVVTVDGPGGAIGAVRARALVHGTETVVGLANRVVRPGADHRFDPPEAYHYVHRDLTVTVSGARGPYAVELPLARLRGEAAYSLPALRAARTVDGAVAVELPELLDMAALLITPTHGPLLGVALPQRVRPADSEFDVTVRVVNPSPVAQEGEIRLDLSPPLRAISAAQTVVLAAGSQADVNLRAAVPPDTAPGYYLVQAIGSFGGATHLSTSLELEVRPDLELALPTPVTSIFPNDDPAPQLTVAGRSQAGAAVTLTARLVLSEGYRADADSKPLVLPADGSEGSVSFTLSAEPDAPSLGQAALVVEGSVRGRSVREERAYRLARDLVTYREPKSARLGASEESRREMELVCLENRFVKATFYPMNGVFHELFSHASGTDCLGRGDYPFGAVWYGGPNVAFVEFQSTGDAAVALFKGSYLGHELTMTATLGKDSHFVRVVWDCGAAPPIGAAYYVMSRLSLGGAADVLTAPLKTERLSMDWKSRRQRRVALAELAAPLLGVVDTTGGETFVATFGDLPFDQVLLMTREASHNYMVFSGGDRAPGRFWYAFGVVPGGWDAAEAATQEAMANPPR